MSLRSHCSEPGGLSFILQKVTSFQDLHAPPTAYAGKVNTCHLQRYRLTSQPRHHLGPTLPRSQSARARRPARVLDRGRPGGAGGLQHLRPRVVVSRRGVAKLLALGLHSSVSPTSSGPAPFRALTLPGPHPPGPQHSRCRCPRDDLRAGRFSQYGAQCLSF